MTRPTWEKTVDLALVLLVLGTLLITLNAYLRSIRDGATEASWLPVMGQPLPGIMTRGDGAGAVPFTPDSAFLRGRVHALFFFRSDCPHCGLVVSAWKKILTRWGIVIGDIAVASEPRQDAMQWLERYAFSFDSLVVVPSPGELRKRWKVPGVPCVLFLAPNGRVMLAEFGVLSETAVARIDTYLLEATGS